MTRFFRIFLSGLAIAIISGGCSDAVRQAPQFNQDRAFAYLVQQVEFGPRVPGSEASASCRNYFYEHFRSLDMTVDSQVFIFPDPYSGKEIRMVNVLASYSPPEPTGDRLLLLAHYDSRPRTDMSKDTAMRNLPIDGANDGASGVAVLMELANLVAEEHPGVAVDFLFTDGEDWGKSGDTEYYLLGAREFARRMAGRREYRFGILLDMVGDKNQMIYREGYSERFVPQLNDMIFKVAADLGVSTFVDSVRHTVIDDHLPLNTVGIPTANLIDFDYPYWHTEFDTADKCSAESLKNVGRVVAHILYNKGLWPKMK